MPPTVPARDLAVHWGWSDFLLNQQEPDERLSEAERHNLCLNRCDACVCEHSVRWRITFSIFHNIECQSRVIHQHTAQRGAAVECGWQGCQIGVDDLEDLQGQLTEPLWECRQLEPARQVQSGQPTQLATARRQFR